MNAGTIRKGMVAAVAALGFSAAHATVIINTATQGLYNAGLGTTLDTGGNLDPFPCANVGCGDATVSFPTAPSLAAAAAALGSWLTNPAAPGGSWAGPQAIPSSWAVNTETAIIYTIAAGFGIDNVLVALGVDNGIFVWLDGVYKFGARAGGGAALGEYNVNLGDIGAGTHYLQILREDHGGATGYAIAATGDLVTTPPGQAPSPGSFPLAALGLTALAWWSRRRVTAPMK